MVERDSNPELVASTLEEFAASSDSADLFMVRLFREWVDGLDGASVVTDKGQTRTIRIVWGHVHEDQSLMLGLKKEDSGEGSNKTISQCKISLLIEPDSQRPGHPSHF